MQGGGGGAGGVNEAKAPVSEYDVTSMWRLLQKLPPPLQTSRQAMTSSAANKDTDFQREG